MLKPEVRQHWLDQWAILAQHVFDNEPSLMAYELLEVEGKENTFFVYERFVHTLLMVLGVGALCWLVNLFLSC